MPLDINKSSLMNLNIEYIDQSILIMTDIHPNKDSINKYSILIYYNDILNASNHNYSNRMAKI